MPDTRRVCIVDANILFDFLAGECIDLLFSLPFDIRTSDIVAYEVRFSLTHQRLGQLGLHIEELDGVQTEQVYILRRDYEELSIQDISVYLLAEKYGAYLISGDETLRSFGETHSIECHGTLWFLEILLKMNSLSHHEAALVLRKMLEDARPPRRLPRAECEKRIKKWESMEK